LRYAPVVQWIERPSPKGQIQVRFLSGAFSLAMNPAVTFIGSEGS